MHHIPIVEFYTYEHISLCICKSPQNVREQTCCSCTFAPPARDEQEQDLKFTLKWKLTLTGGLLGALGHLLGALGAVWEASWPVQVDKMPPEGSPKGPKWTSRGVWGSKHDFFKNYPLDLQHRSSIDVVRAYNTYTSMIRILCTG